MYPKITNDEYAVLCEIRNNQSVSDDRLLEAFGNIAEPSLKNLEKYGLITSDISAGRWYYCATNSGKAYTNKVENETDNVDTKNNKPKSKQSIKLSLIKHLKILALIVGIIASIVASVVGITQIFQFFTR